MNRIKVVVIVICIAIFASLVAAAQLPDKSTSCDWAYKKAEEFAITQRLAMRGMHRDDALRSMAYSQLYLACVERVK